MAHCSIPPSIASSSSVNSMATNYDLSPENIYSQPMSIKNIENMLIEYISPNEKPYNAVVRKHNNNLVKKWIDEVLIKIADKDGCVPQGRVWYSWALFLEGQSILKFKELYEGGKICETPDEIIEYWRQIFENSTIEELCQYGTGNIVYGWGLLTTHLKFQNIKMTYAEFFSKSEDPLWWEQHSGEHKMLQDKFMPFGWYPAKMKDIEEKVMALLINKVEPKK